MSVATIAIDHNAVRLLGRKLYSSHPLLIVVRETLQNALDAAFARGVEPEITITLWLDSDAAEVTCQDNGIGMTPDVISGSFLTIGATSKGDGTIGGFGIAAAAIMSCDEWRVHTLDWALSHADLGKHPVRDADSHMDGTLISVKIEKPKWRNRHIADVYHLLAFSSASIRFVVYHGRKKLLDTMTGMRDSLSMLENHKSHPVDWTLKGTGPVTIPVLDLGNSQIGGEIQGLTFVRLNGLVQFELGWSNRQRQTNLIVDIDDPPPVSHPDYPFTMSREQLTMPIQTYIDKAVTPHTSNPLTSARIVREPAVSLTVLPGQVLSGVGNDALVSDKNRESIEACPQPTVWLENAFSLTASSAPSSARAPQRLKVLLRDYRYRDIPLQHWKILTLWAEVVRLTAPANEVFGVGLTTADVNAERITHHGDVYYVINSTLASRGLRGRALVLRLWALACHELAHLACPNHSELFSSEMDRIAAESAGRVAKAQPGLVKVYTQRQKPSWLLSEENSCAARPQEVLL